MKICNFCERDIKRLEETGYCIHCNRQILDYILAKIKEVEK